MGKKRFSHCLRKTIIYGTFIEDGYMLKITRGTKMETDDDIMSAEEFFGGITGGKKSPRKCRTRGKKPQALFAAVKAKMVMRIYGVSRAKALKIIANRENETRVAEGEEADRSAAEGRDGEFMSARELFGE